MDIKELKKMLKGSTAVLILDNGEPSFVVVSYDNYRELLQKGETEIAVHNGPATVTPAMTNAGELELLERINKDILALKEQIEEEEKNLGI